MKAYVIINAPKGTSNKQYQNIINAKGKLRVFKAGGKEPYPKSELDMIAKRDGHRVVEVNLNARLGKGVTPSSLEGAIVVDPKLRKVTIVKDVTIDVSSSASASNESSSSAAPKSSSAAPKSSSASASNKSSSAKNSNESSAEPSEASEEKKKKKKKNKKNEEENTGYSIWAKLGLGALSSAVIGGGLFAAKVVPGVAIATVATQAGVSVVAATGLICGAAGIAATLIAAGAYFAVKQVYDYLNAPIIQTKDEYRAELKNELKAVEKLTKKLPAKFRLKTKLANLLDGAKARRFDEDGQPKAENKQPTNDKLLVARWEHKKLDNLFAKPKNEQKTYAAKIAKNKKFA